MPGNKKPNVLSRLEGKFIKTEKVVCLLPISMDQTHQRGAALRECCQAIRDKRDFISKVIVVLTGGLKKHYLSIFNPQYKENSQAIKDAAANIDIWWRERQEEHLQRLGVPFKIIHWGELESISKSRSDCNFQKISYQDCFNLVEDAFNRESHFAMLVRRQASSYQRRLSAKHNNPWIINDENGKPTPYLIKGQVTQDIDNQTPHATSPEVHEAAITYLKHETAGIFWMGFLDLNCVISNAGFKRIIAYPGLYNEAVRYLYGKLFRNEGGNYTWDLHNPVPWHVLKITQESESLSKNDSYSADLKVVLRVLPPGETANFKALIEESGSSRGFLHTCIFVFQFANKYPNQIKSLVGAVTVVLSRLDKPKQGGWGLFNFFSWPVLSSTCDFLSQAEEEVFQELITEYRSSRGFSFWRSLRFACRLVNRYPTQLAFLSGAVTTLLHLDASNNSPSSTNDSLYSSYSIEPSSSDCIAVNAATLVVRH